MHEPITYVGIDAHARELLVAMLPWDASEPTVWTSPNEPRAIERLRRRLERDAPGPIECCYEAGPTGYALQRRLTTERIRCRVIAPSLIPEKPGDRIKTDRRDARKLVLLLRADLLTAIQPPSEAAEAVRDVIRARDAARVDLMRSRHRLSKLLLRRGHLYPRTPWTGAFRTWLAHLEWPHPAERHVVRAYQLAIAHVEARLADLDGVIVELALTPPYQAAVPLRRGESWAWWALAISGLAGFASFLSYLGHGYLDTWHGAATLSLLPLFAGGLIRTRGSRRDFVEAQPLDIHSSAGVGHALLLLSSVGICAAGVTIMAVGMTSVFVPQDLEFIGMTRAAIGAINPNLIPLIAHDRAGFGGALVSFGIAMFACVRYARVSRTLRHVLATAGVAGFATAVGVHPVIGYVSLTHLGPAVLACAVFAAGLALSPRLPAGH